MKRLGILAAMCLLAGTTAVMAQDGEQQPSQQQPADATAVTAAGAQTEPQLTEEEQREADEVVCRTERATGSLTRRNRVCMTRAEWSNHSRGTARELNRITSGAAGGVSCSRDPMGGC